MKKVSVWPLAVLYMLLGIAYAADRLLFTDLSTGFSQGSCWLRYAAAAAALLAMAPAVCAIPRKKQYAQGGSPWALMVLAAICLGQIWIKHQEKVRTMAEQAAKGNSVAFADGDVVSGWELWRDFYETTQAGNPASVRLVSSYSAMEPDDTHCVTREHTYYVQELTFDENMMPQDIERYETSSVWEREPLDACGIYTEYVWKEEYRYLHEH